MNDELEPLTPETLLSIVVAQNTIGKAMLSSRDQIRFEVEKIEPINRNIFTEESRTEKIAGYVLAGGIGAALALVIVYGWVL